MKGDLFINNTDATRLGIAMGAGFLGNLLSPAALKEFVTNEDPAKDGKDIIIENPRLAARELTLTFTILGDSPQDHIQKYNSFVTLLQQGQINLRVPALGPEIYHLKYSGVSGSYSLSKDRTTSNLTVKFEEFNPANRSDVLD